MYDELRDYLLYMAERTGTLWENQQPSASCCHALTSDEPALFLKIFGTAQGVDPIGGVGVVK